LNTEVFNSRIFSWC